MNRHQKFTWIALAAPAVIGFALPAAAQQSFGDFEAPQGWLPPPLNPTGVQLETTKLGPGVYALLSNKPPVDNAGFVVGERGVLVIDAHFNGAMARQIQAAIRKVTDKPILYLVNTNSHGDHTFGNYAFPAETKIVAHRKTAEAMRNFEAEKKFLLATVDGDPAVFSGVRLRLPDVVFEESLRLDLGGRVVELHHFGHGNTPGDTVVYVPEARVAWTGNLVLGEGTIPWAIEGDTPAYRKTIARLAGSLDIKTIVGGHLPMTSRDILDTYLRYLSEHINSVQGAIRSGQTLEQTLASMPLADSYLPSVGSPLAALRPVMKGFHLWNVKKTYLELKAGTGPVTQVRHRTLQIDGLDIFYREAGPADAPTILLLHGFPTSSHMFRNLIPALATEFHLVAPDYPGYGNSSMPSLDEFDYSFDHFAEIVDTFTEKLGLDKYSLYLMDYGAPVGFRLAVKHPERVEALIIQNGNAYDEGLLEFWDPIKTYWKAHTPENAAALRGLLTIDATKWQYTHGVRDLEAISPDNWNTDQQLLDRPGNAEIQLAMFYDYRTNVPLYPQWQTYFRSYQPPTLIVWGKNDPIFPAEGAHPYKRDLRDLEFHLLETGHFALEEDGDVIAELIRSFLKRKVPRGN